MTQTISFTPFNVPLPLVTSTCLYPTLPLLLHTSLPYPTITTPYLPTLPPPLLPPTPPPPAGVREHPLRDEKNDQR